MIFQEFVKPIGSVNGFVILGFSISVPCKRGVCTTPIQVTAGHLIGTAKWPAVFVKATLYPGAIFESLLFKTEVPTFNGLLHAYNMTALDETFDVQRIEVRYIKTLAVSK